MRAISDFTDHQNNINKGTRMDCCKLLWINTFCGMTHVLQSLLIDPVGFTLDWSKRISAVWNRTPRYDTSRSVGSRQRPRHHPLICLWPNSWSLSLDWPFLHSDNCIDTIFAASSQSYWITCLTTNLRARIKDGESISSHSVLLALVTNCASACLGSPWKASFSGGVTLNASDTVTR